MSACEPLGAPRKAAILISSTRAALGIYEDASAPIISDWLQEQNFDVMEPVIVPDGPAVGAALTGMLLAKPSVIITSGGTGLSPDDTTPEETEKLLNFTVPGIMEALRAAGRENTPMAALSRGHAGVTGATFIVNLPGSPSGVMDGLSVLTPLLTHICEQLEGSHAHH
ncbi:MogA/MoaB family molybdenum cofactor biosynthesis protein [Paeniglutamicibacter antarcticus]|uniref:MogA/MoaB family molybdenum cofactor biosynthesis protein n=1 Tax=Paeniglutamicibacter antarcticus TaxID=494023 RepID=A0ABP9TR42_9MICC